MAVGIASDIHNLLGILDRDTRFRVPIYQRGFSWRSENINRLWDDLQETLLEPEDEQSLFLGSIVLNHEDGVINLVDGQQRLTTLSILAALVRHQLLKQDPMPQSRIRLVTKVEDLLFVRGDAGGAIRLELSDRDRAAFRELVKTGSVKRAPAGIRRCATILSTLLTEELVGRDEDEYLGKLLEVLRSVVTLSRIDVYPPYSPFTVFERLNSTGLSLAGADLVKNRVLQKATSNDRRDLSELWEKMVTEIGDNDVTDFLRAWWIAQRGFVSKKQLYNAVRQEVKSPDSAAQLVNSWYAAASLYAQMIEGSLVEGTPAVRSAIATAARLGFKQGNPVLLCLLLSETGKNYIPRAVDALERIFIRVLKVAQRRGSKFEAELDGICKALKKKPAEGIRNLEEIADRLCRDAGPLNLRGVTVIDGTLARHMLVSLARIQHGPTWDAPDTSELEVEHILPRNRPPGFMSNVPEEDYRVLVSRLGNLTLILREDNVRCSNQVFEEKRGIYAEYQRKKKVIQMTGDLVESLSWTEIDIAAREEKLTPLAEEAWPIKGPT
ncbi:MAG: DUF262 domain-containing protein [Thermoplasmatota archaeon]